MSLAWGGTWAAVKVGVELVPPIFLAALRYVLVAAALALFVRGFLAPFASGALRRTLITGALVNVGTYAALFWGMQFVPSGVSGLINLSLVPVGLLGFSVLVGETRVGWRHVAAVAVGVVGLIVLFSGKLQAVGSRAELVGAAAIVAATAFYCLGTVLSRPLLGRFSPLQLEAAQAMVGAAGLALLAALLEPISGDTLRALGSPQALASVAYLVVIGTLLGFTIYLRLVRDWGAPRAGLYAFISPIVALCVGWLLFGERIGWREAAGAVLMLAAAGGALRALGEKP
jgi:drug/metabolite transporter (DMT)-like permease